MKIDLAGVPEALTRLQRQLGATEEPELPAAVLKKLAEEGIVSDDIPRSSEGVFRWHKQVVVLYIQNQAASAVGYRFHIAECGTIDTMRLHGRGGRYIVTNRGDGRFPVRSNPRGPVSLLSMVVCRNCLSRLDWEGYRQADYRQRARLVNEFSIADFLDTYRHAQRPIRWAEKPKPARPRPGPVSVAPSSPAGQVGALPPEELWVEGIDDAQFRQVALHIQRFRNISEAELNDMVGGPRRARRFGLAVEELFASAPFGVEARSVLGVKSYFRVVR